MKLINLFNEFATKCGKQNEPAVIDLLSRADLQNIDLADEVANAINNSLMTIDSAKNNPLLKSHFYALALGSADAEIMKTVELLNLGEDFKNEISGVQNTYDKQRKLASKVQEAIEALKAAKGNGNEKDIEKYTKKINDLNLQISQLKETTVPKSELDVLKQTHEKQLTDYAFGNLLNSFNFADKGLSREDMLLVAKSKIEKALDGKAVLTRENNTLKLKNANDPALDYYDDSQKTVSFSDFAGKILADNKMLAVSGGKPNNTITQPNGGGNELDTSRYDASVAFALGE
jgi:hypothetical protein